MNSLEVINFCRYIPNVEHECYNRHMITTFGSFISSFSCRISQFLVTTIKKKNIFSPHNITIYQLLEQTAKNNKNLAYCYKIQTNETLLSTRPLQGDGPHLRLGLLSLLGFLLLGPTCPLPGIRIVTLRKYPSAARSSQSSWFSSFWSRLHRSNSGRKSSSGRSSNRSGGWWG